MLSSLIFLLVIFFLIFWGGARIGELIYIFQNAIPFTEWKYYIDPLNIMDVWNVNDFSKSIFQFLILLFIFLLVLVLVFRIRLFSSRTRLSKTKRENYTSWQNHLERRRALYRIMWNDKGQIETGVLERWYDSFFKDLIEKHNAILAEYNRPVYEYWNEQKEFKIPITEKISSLEVNVAEVKDDE